jgi:hypothetical protein
MQFQVPQFIETEAKIVGPLTMKQFFFVGGAAALVVFFYFSLPFFVFIVLSFIVFSLAIALAFMKYNGQPLPTVLKSAFFYFWNPRFYIWKTSPEVIKPIKVPKVPMAGQTTPRPKLKDLFFKLTTTTKNIAQREHNLNLSSIVPNEVKEKFEVIRKASGERAAARRIDYS